MDQVPNPPLQPGMRSSKSFGLPLKLLLLTLGFIMLAEVLIFLPSIGREQQDYLTTQLASGHLAVLALEASPSGMVSTELRDELLNHANASLVGLKIEGGKNLALTSGSFDPSGSMIRRTIDLRDAGFLTLIQQALTTLFRAGKTDKVRVLGYSPKQDKARVELVVPEAPLVRHLRAFGWRILLISLIISIIAASLIYLSLLWLLVRPVNHLTRSMERFAQFPEREVIDLPKRISRDELGHAQRQLNAMQGTVRTAFKERARLAALGTAVTKINHDLRNVLSTSLLLSDSLEISKDPIVKKIAPKLIVEIERAADLCTSTLKFARGEAPEIERSYFSALELFEEIKDRLLRREDVTADIEIHVSQATDFFADRNQIDRLFSNLVLNAAQAGAKDIALRLSAENSNSQWNEIEILDNGPGLPNVTINNLFQPFSATTKKDGSGLGLSITRDIAQSHGGEIALRETGSEGTCFVVRFDKQTLMPAV